LKFFHNLNEHHFVTEIIFIRFSISEKYKYKCDVVLIIIEFIFARGMNMSWFKEKIVEIGEMTSRSTSPPNLINNTDKISQRIRLT